jgi:hypothetical protein
MPPRPPFIQRVATRAAATALSATTALTAAPAAPAVAQSVPRIEVRRLDAHPEPFSRVRGLRELGTGVVLVTDWIEERLVAVDLAAGTQTAIGRVGGGPQEYRLPAQLLAVPGDSTLLVDVGNDRLAVIGPDLAIHRTFPARTDARRYPVTPRAVGSDGRIFFAIPPWFLREGAPPGDSVDVAAWDPRSDDVDVIGRLKGHEPPSWQREGRPRLTPGIPMVGYAPQDAWAVAADGRVALVRAGDYHVEWRATNGQVLRGPSYAYERLPVTDADKRAFVAAFLQSSPMSGRGPDGGMGHTPGEFQTAERVAQAIRTNEFAERHPYFRPGGAWVAPDGALWVERSVPAGAALVLDVFDDGGRMVRQVILPAGRRLVGVGREVLYAVAADPDGLETLERYRSR